MEQGTEGSANDQASPWWIWALEIVCVTGAYAALAVWLLAPVFDHPTDTLANPAGAASLFWQADVNLIVWVMAWDWHALTTAPTRLFDANIFHPAPLALAGSEHMLGHAPIFGPIYALSGNPVLAYQINLLLAFALSGTAMYLLVRHWGGLRGAALFAGFVYAFHPLRAEGIAHAHLLADQYLPLGLLFLDRTLVEEKLRFALACGLCLLLEALCSYYLLYMTLTAVGGYLLGMLWVRKGRVPLRGAFLLGVAALAAGAVIVVLTLPYLKLKHAGLIPRAQIERELIKASAGWHDYVWPRRWAIPGSDIGRVYVGALPLACAVIALWKARQRAGFSPSWAIPASLGLTAVGYLMAAGPSVQVAGWTVPLPYSLMERWVPGFASMRVPIRFGLVVMCGIAALAGVGCSRLLLWLKRRGTAALVTALVPATLIAGTAWDYNVGSQGIVVRRMLTGRNVPAVYDQLANSPAGPVLELPAAQLREASSPALQSQYMVYSTVHWHPLLNGYSGYAPPSYALLMSLAHSLPDTHAVKLLQRLSGLRYVVVHLGLLPPYERPLWAHPPGLRSLGEFRGAKGADLLFEVGQAEAADLIPRLLDERERATTLEGTPLRPLAPEEEKAEFQPVAKLAAVAPQAMSYLVDVRVRNSGSETWPALAISDNHTVMLATRWERPDGVEIATDTAAARLPYDVPPGATVRVNEAINVPDYVGPVRLRLGLAQDGRWFQDEFGPIPIELRPLSALLGLHGKPNGRSADSQ